MTPHPTPDPVHATSLLDVRGVSVTFGGRRRWGGRPGSVRAVVDVSLGVAPEETVALVGESGSGKSTLARAVCGLVAYDGSITIRGKDLAAMGRDGRAAARLRQIVFQDPYSSLNPTMTIVESIAEPLRVVDGMSAGDARQRAAELLEAVQLPRSFGSRLPSQLSGGQRQRVAIARAIALEPPLVICDEALSALDVSTQREILELLGDLGERRGLAYLFIAHDLSVVRYIAQRVAVMYFGRLVEVGSTEAVFGNPAHPYTRSLLAAAPVPNPRVQRSRTRSVLTGELPDPTRPPAGCVFHPRCPEAVDLCRLEDPAPRSVGPGVVVRCHLHDMVPVTVRSGASNG